MTVCADLIKKLQSYPEVSFAEVAKTAYQVGKLSIATKVGWSSHILTNLPHPSLCLAP